jgi:predicted ATP-grasp superfamily ATP-dependent carboligase
MSRDNPAFVFNTHYNGLGVIRAYGRAGIPVVAMDTHRSVGTFSRYARYKCCPDPVFQEDAFIESLLEERKKYPLNPLLFPTNDHWAMAVSRHKEKLIPYFYVMTPDYKCIQKVIDKQKFYQLTAEKSFNIPKTYKLNDICRKTGQIEFPIVAKPLARRISSNDLMQKENQKLFDRLRLTRMEDETELEFFLSTCFDKHHFLFQEEIQGGADRMYTVGIYADQNSDVLAAFTGRKVRGANPLYGDCVVGQVEQVPSELIQETKRLIKELRYTGIAEVEYKKDIRNDEFRLIEVNPRSWSWIGITPFCDVNLPLIAYEDMVKGKKNYTVSRNKTGSVKWMKIIDDFNNCMWRYSKNGFPEASMNLTSWMRGTFKNSKVVMEDFSIIDPVPTLWGIVQFFKNKVAAVIRKLSGKYKAGDKS